MTLVIEFSSESVVQPPQGDFGDRLGASPNETTKLRRRRVSRRQKPPPQPRLSRRLTTSEGAPGAERFGVGGRVEAETDHKPAALTP